MPLPDSRKAAGESGNSGLSWCRSIPGIAWVTRAESLERHAPAPLGLSSAG